MRNAIPGQNWQPQKPDRRRDGRFAYRVKISKWAWSIFAGVFAVSVGTGLPFASAAEPSESFEKVRADLTVNCEDRLRLDRRDDPQNALRNFRQCGAAQSLSANIENLTFLYITAQHSSNSQNEFAFEPVWKSYIGILTGQSVGFKPAKASEILDAGIVRGLRRGRRDDLTEKWLAAHNPAVLRGDKPAESPHASTRENPPEPGVRTAASPVAEKSAFNPPRKSTAQHQRSRRVENRP